MWVQEGADLQELQGHISCKELGRIFLKWVFLNLLDPIQLEITTSAPFQPKNLDVASKGLCLKEAELASRIRSNIQIT